MGKDPCCYTSLLASITSTFAEQELVRGAGREDAFAFGQVPVTLTKVCPAARRRTSLITPDSFGLTISRKPILWHHCPNTAPLLLTLFANRSSARSALDVDKAQVLKGARRKERKSGFLRGADERWLRLPGVGRQGDRGLRRWTASSFPCWASARRRSACDW